MNDSPPLRRAVPLARGGTAQSISVFGAGYVGLVTAACLAELGHRVWCVDTDPDRVRWLRQARIPFHEPQLPELVAAHLRSGRLRFGTDGAAAAAQAGLHVVAVGTPPQHDGSPDTRQVLSVARLLAEHLSQPAVVMLKSTVPVGTGDTVQSLLSTSLSARDLRWPVAVCSNPEFLREGCAVQDFMQPDRVVIGGDDPAALRLLQDLYAPVLGASRPLLLMDRRSAEFTKYAANAMLAARLSAVNELALLADALGADFETARAGVGADRRLGSAFMVPGCGYGGSCLPKDVAALLHAGHRQGLALPLLQAVDQVNQRQKGLLLEWLAQHLPGPLAGRHVALWGLAFKPGTDDVRESPGVCLLRSLLDAGCTVTAHDPLAMPAVQRLLGPRPGLSYVADAMDALAGAEALLIATDWPEYAHLSPALLRARLRRPLVLDGRHLFDPLRMADAGLLYHAIGRTAPASAAVPAASQWAGEQRDRAAGVPASPWVDEAGPWQRPPADARSGAEARA